MHRRLCAWFLCGLMVIVSVGGCKFKPLPDPNDPNEVGLQQPEVLQNTLKGANEALFERWVKKEIDEPTYLRLMTQFAKDLLDDVKISDIPPPDAWRYAEVYITAKQWPDAERVLRIAVKHAVNADRRVNDSLRLARAIAMQGRVKEAIPIANQLFDVPDKDKAPILFGVLYEIVPAGRGQRQDPQLAKLLERAIGAAKQTVVDASTESGKAFLQTRPIHIGKAWALVVELYDVAGKTKDADRARLAAMRDFEGNVRT